VFSDRNEVYRHSFGKPPEIVIRTSDEKSAASYGLLLDLSLKGAKVFSEAELAEGMHWFELKFHIHHDAIRTKAELVWKAPQRDGWTYGFRFRKDPVREMLLAKELGLLKEQK
jgi:hypothetical protein